MFNVVIHWTSSYVNCIDLVDCIDLVVSELNCIGSVLVDLYCAHSSEYVEVCCLVEYGRVTGIAIDVLVMCCFHVICYYDYVIVLFPCRLLQLFICVHMSRVCSSL